MIKQCAATDIKSRSECNPFDNTEFLPLIVAPMYSCVDKSNAHIFLHNKVKICMPRKEYMDESYKYCSKENYFDSYSLEDFIENFINTTDGFLTNKENNIVKTSVCIDTAAGHLKALHEAIRQAKEIHGNNLVIMAGNVSSAEAFVELATTGCNFIRVGIGGGASCLSSLQTGVGQENLEQLIYQCRKHRDFFKDKESIQAGIISKVKIVADGISRFVDQLVERKEGLDNGYAAINRLLYAGADIVMIGKLFAQSIESAGEKRKGIGYFFKETEDIYSAHVKHPSMDEVRKAISHGYEPQVKYSGMSTRESQMKYKEGEIKPSEGKSTWLPIKWSLSEWLNGSEKESDYLPGWVNALKSSMSYTGSKTLKDFKQ